MLRRCKYCKSIYKAKNIYSKVCENCKKLNSKYMGRKKIQEEELKRRRKISLTKRKKSHLSFSDNTSKLKYEFERLRKNLWDLKNREKRKIKIYAQMKSYNIEIPKNQLCEMCNKNKAKFRHHEDYSKPLEVKFVCIDCHFLIHKKENELKLKEKIISIKKEISNLTDLSFK